MLPSHTVLVVLRVLGFVLTVILWNAVELVDHPFRIGIATLSALLVFPVVILFRRMLDDSPTQERCTWLTSFLHMVLMVFFGVAIVETLVVYSRTPVWFFPVPRMISGPLVLITGMAALMTVLNLALSGLGAPFAIALSRRLANRWMYAWTRNPMVVSLLSCLCSVALYFQSFQFLLWILFILTPPWIFFLKMYEERELEIRFGESYLEYKRKTPFFWPGKPGEKEGCSYR